MRRLNSLAHAKVKSAAHKAANTALPREKDRFAEVCLNCTSALALLRVPLLCLVTGASAITHGLKKFSFITNMDKAVPL